MTMFTMNHIIQMRPVRSGIFVVLTLGLVGCGVISDRLAAQKIKRVTTLPADQACDAPEQNEPRLTGAFLRQSAASGSGFVPVLVAGRASRSAIDPDLTINEQSQTRETQDIRGTTVVGSKSGTAKRRPGFGPPDAVPNVYDISFEAQDITFSGPMVVGPSSFGIEMPSSGATLFSGRIEMDFTTQDESGAAQTVRAQGRFSMQAGYGSQSGSLTASGFDADLPFDTLSWSNLLLCGTRFVSGGQGIVTVQTEGGPPLAPFKTDRATAPFVALFEAALFAPQERPATPTSLGGIFVIQSDNGTLRAVFLSDQLPEPDADV